MLTPRFAVLPQGRILFTQLKGNAQLDPVNDTSLDPSTDLHAALKLYPERAEPLVMLSRYSEWLRDNWCHRDYDPPVCRMQHQVAAFEYARIAAEKPLPGGVRTPASGPLIMSVCRPARGRCMYVQSLLQQKPAHSKGLNPACRITRRSLLQGIYSTLICKPRASLHLPDGMGLTHASRAAVSGHTLRGSGRL
jgi:hypothetical protein